MITIVIRIIRINKRGHVFGHPDAEIYDYHIEEVDIGEDEG
ncbi:hypothetical protein [Metabacillus litoralis]|nr:hypothetical protein [Metabacillus litoralis]